MMGSKAMVPPITVTVEGCPQNKAEAGPSEEQEMCSCAPFLSDTSKNNHLRDYPGENRRAVDDSRPLYASVADCCRCLDRGKVLRLESGILRALRMLMISTGLPSMHERERRPEDLSSAFAVGAVYAYDIFSRGGDIFCVYWKRLKDRRCHNSRA
jgi:hypothetical protein